MIKTIQLTFDYEAIQRDYQARVIHKGLVLPQAVIREIHTQTYEKADWIDENGRRCDGWELVDTSGNGFYGYSYDLVKDGIVVLSTVDEGFTMGFRKEDVEGLILGEVEIEVGKYLIAEKDISDYAALVGGKFKNAVIKFEFEFDGESYFAATKKDFDFFVARLSALRNGELPAFGIPKSCFNAVLRHDDVA